MSELDAKLQARLAAIADRIMANPNADGWIRLCEILKKARTDKRIASSAGASEFLELMCELAADALTTSNAKQAIKPLTVAQRSIDQSKIAKVPRGKLTDTGDNLGDVIARLASRKDETAPELWPQLYAELDALGLDPKETEDRDDQRKSLYDYGDDRHITFGQFANRISKIRTKSG